MQSQNEVENHIFRELEHSARAVKKLAGGFINREKKPEDENTDPGFVEVMKYRARRRVRDVAQRAVSYIRPRR